MLPTDTGQEKHKKPGRHKHDSRAQIRLYHDKTRRNQGQRQRKQHDSKPGRHSAAGEQPGHSHRYSQFHQFRRLKSDQTEVEPALSTLACSTHNQHGHQQDYTHGKKVRGKTAQILRRYLSHRHHDCQRDTKPKPLASHNTPVLARSTENHNQSQSAQDQQANQQWAIQMQSPTRKHRIPQSKLPAASV